MSLVPLLMLAGPGVAAKRAEWLLRLTLIDSPWLLWVVFGAQLSARPGSNRLLAAVASFLLRSSRALWASVSLCAFYPCDSHPLFD